MTAPSGPLAETLERLAGVGPWFGGHLGEPEGDGWHRFSDVFHDDRLAVWVDDLAAHHDGRRDVAGSYLGGWLAGAATAVPTAALVLERRLPDPAGELWFHRREEGWFDRVAFEGTGVFATSADPAASHPDVVVVATADLPRVFARGLVDRLTPVLDAVRGAAPFGRSGLWGGVADELASAALGAARAAGTDTGDAWRLAEAVTDAIAEERRWLRARPRPFAVTTGRGTTAFIVRGTCCLYYKTQPPPPDASGDSHCNTCPFRDDDSRHRRLAAAAEA
jgi:hypothetical protein